jgi:conjugative relaxase-like TrwC/TraI family protein
VRVVGGREAVVFVLVDGVREGGDRFVVTVEKVRSVAYYLEQVARDLHDYYVGEGESPGVWAGQLASAFGLSGEVSEEQFRAMLEEKHPVTGERLKWRPNTKVPGWDVTFSPPKSVSALWAIASDEEAVEIRAAEVAATRVAMEKVLEEFACVARLGKAGVDRQAGTGFLGVDFAHRLSREGDPQLHIHKVIANVLETADGRRSAIDGTLLKKWRWAADAVYLEALRCELTRRLGVRWIERNGTWEVDGIPAELCRLWSTRRFQILAKLAEWGTSGGRAAQAAALATRRSKTGREEPAGLRQRLRDAVRRVGLDPDRLRHHSLDRDFDPPSGPRLSDEEIIDRLVGPEGLTKQASGFGYRDVIAAIGQHLVASERDAAAAAERILRLADRVLDDPRVIALMEPARRLSGEVIKLRDDQGRIIGTVCTEAERHYSTAGLLACELELVTRAQARQHDHVAVVPEPLLGQVLDRYPELDPDQHAMVAHVCSSGHGVDVVVGKAGTGKTRALAVAREAYEAAGVEVLGVAPTAAAARQLHHGAGINACTVDRLLVEVEHGNRTLSPGGVIVVDEAGMCSTRKRLALQQVADEAGCKILDVGDHRQIPSVDVGGAHLVLAETLGAVTLGVDHRFKLPALRDAAELIRDGQPEVGIEVLRELGMVHEHDDAHDVRAAMVDRWLELRDAGADVTMLGSENAVVDELNARARHALVARGEVDRRGRRYVSHDRTREIELSRGDRVRLGHNTLIPGPNRGGVKLFNGMEAIVVKTSRHGLVVRLDDDHVPEGGPQVLELPGWYAGAHVDHGYACTADKAQGITVDHVLFAPSAATANERAYVALSRGRYSNEIYATRQSGWEDAIAESAGHTFASHQAPEERQQPDRSEVVRRLLERHQQEQERRAYREQYLRDRGRDPALERDDDRGISISI